MHILWWSPNLNKIENPQHRQPQGEFSHGKVGSPHVDTGNNVVGYCAPLQCSSLTSRSAHASLKLCKVWYIPCLHAHEGFPNWRPQLRLHEAQNFHGCRVDQKVWHWNLWAWPLEALYDKGDIPLVCREAWPTCNQRDNDYETACKMPSQNQIEFLRKKNLNCTWCWEEEVEQKNCKGDESYLRQCYLHILSLTTNHPLALSALGPLLTILAMARTHLELQKFLATKFDNKSNLIIFTLVPTMV